MSLTILYPPRLCNSSDAEGLGFGFETGCGGVGVKDIQGSYRIKVLSKMRGSDIAIPYGWCLKVLEVYAPQTALKPF